jgi:CxxC motif-containing protein
MKNILILTLSILIFASCNTISGDGNIITQNRGSFNDYHSIVVGNMLTVSVNASTFGNEKSVSIKTDSNIQEYVIVEQKNKVLYIEVKKNYKLETEKLHVELNTPTNFVLINKGIGEISIGGPEFEDVEVENSGSGIISINTLVQSIKVKQSGSGNITLNEKINNILIIKNSGSGDVLVNDEVTQGIEMYNRGSGNISALKAKASSALVNNSGSGECSVEVLHHLAANISGSGDVKYKGDPEIVKDITGSGKLIKL